MIYTILTGLSTGAIGGALVALYTYAALARFLAELRREVSELNDHVEKMTLKAQTAIARAGKKPPADVEAVDTGTGQRPGESTEAWRRRLREMMVSGNIKHGH